MKKKRVILLALFFSMYGQNFVFSHCDTMDGPVIADAKRAIEQDNVNYVLKWIPVENEEEIKGIFDLAMNVRLFSPEARELSDMYFFENLVRIHRSSEGVPYTGILPSGTPIDKKIKAADKSIEQGNLFPLEKLIPQDKLPELKKRFELVMQLKNFDVDDIQSGREYIEAYVQFFHFAEGETEGHDHQHVEDTNHFVPISWILSGIFFITSIIYGTLYYRKK